MEEIVSTLRKNFYSGMTLEIGFRLKQLAAINSFINQHEKDLIEAIHKDLKKPKAEAVLAEIHDVRRSVEYVSKNLSSWMAPSHPSVPLVNMMDGCKVQSEPLGVVLIIGAWNYPVQLSLLPLVGAVAAGCCAVVKPSEVSSATSRVIAQFLPKFMDEKCFRVIEGGVQETTELLACKWDHIFYTGNGKVGRVVMAAAAKNLTTVTLELGGKSPCIITRSIEIKPTAQRIAWGKCFNNGQTCVAPDYLLVTDASLVDPLVEAIKAAVTTFYGQDIQKNPDYGRIVNANHFNRIKNLVESSLTFTPSSSSSAPVLGAPSAAAEVVFGGLAGANESDLFIPPTIIKNVHPDSPLMTEEIFGPILPIIVVKDLDEAIQFVNGRDKPLALYAFTSSHSEASRIQNRTSSGGMCINDVMMHVTVPELPFGGVGPSGNGNYHGRASFDCFSHKKSIMHKDQGMEFINEKLRYPQYTDVKMNRLLYLLG